MLKCESRVNWDAIAAISEAIGVLAVVISIIYLAVEVRLGRVWSKKQAFEGYLGLLFGWFSKISTDSDTARLYNSGRDSFRSLSEEDKTRFSHLMIEKFACIELLREYDKDALSKVEAVGRIPAWIREDFRHDGIREWWEEFGRKFMAEDFVNYIDDVSGTRDST